MNIEADPSLEEEFTIRLLACEEALAAGTPVNLVGDTSPEMRTRLLRGLECMQRLQQLRPQQPSVESEGAWPARIGRFEIRGPLGQGGFGIVYRAYDPVLCREVALKIPRADALIDAECRARFQREARAAAGLDHPNLVPVHEAGQLGPISYIAFAYCPGSDLATWLKQRKTPVRCLEAARLVQTLARAIHYAHGRGILHRDLKPSNVLLSPASPGATPAKDNLWLPEADSALIPRVTDFGLAKLAVSDQSQTQSADLLGTPSYMAPEQVEGRRTPAGPAIDVYSLGGILYEVLTGRPPFWGENAVATLRQVELMEPVRPSRLRPELPRDLETICLKCLQKEPRKRYASAEALADDLDRFLTGRPIKARPTGLAEQALKWARRRPALAASLAALLVVTLVGTIAILDQWHQTQNALSVAVRRREQAQQARQAEARERERTELALYHHGVVLAHHEWLGGNVERSAQLLDASRAEFRNWEWRYVRRLCDSAQFTCKGHSAQIMSVAFSPDGRYFASGAGEWNTSAPGEMKLWNAATGELLWTGLEHKSPVMSIAFSPDGRRLVSTTNSWARKGDDVRIWEVATGKLLNTFLARSTGNFGVAFNLDGSQLAIGGGDAKVRILDANTGTELSTLDGHTDSVFGVAFSPDGKQLASAGRDGAAIIWDLASQRAVHALRGTNDLRSVEFSADGKHLVAASFGHNVSVWDAASGDPLLTYWSHRFPVLHAAISPDGRRVASTDSGGIVQVWDIRTGRTFRTVRGHTGAVSGAAFSPDGRHLATGGRDRTLRHWDITHEQDAQSLPEAGGAQSVAFSSKGRFLAAAGYLHTTGKRENRVRVWSMDNRAGPRYWKGHANWVRCVAFSPDEKLLASGSADRTIRLWDVATGQTLRELKNHTDMVTGVDFNRAGTFLASASLDKSVQLWDLAGEKLLLPALTHPHAIYGVAFSPDGKRLVSVGDNGMVLVWDAATGQKLFALPGHSGIVERGIFSPDGRRLATTGWDKTIRIWDMTTDPAEGEAAAPLYVLEGHTDRIVGLSISPDGHRLASTGGDQTIRLWDLDSGDSALTLRGHPDFVSGVAFSPDGRLLVSASTRDIKVWDANDVTPDPLNLAQAQRDVATWHEQEAMTCRYCNPPNWFGVAFHSSRLLDIRPDDWRSLGSRAHAEVELGQWRQAADDAAHSIALGANDHSVWFTRALASLQLGDTDVYRRTCASLLERINSEKRPGSVRDRGVQTNDDAWMCVLAPAAVADLDRVVRLAESAVAAQPGNGVFRNTLGAALYRSGRFQAALAELRKQQGCPDDWLFLAMVQHRLGNAAEARNWLDKVTNWIAEAKHDGRAAAKMSRGHHAQIEILYREAAALLAGSGQSAKDL